MENLTNWCVYMHENRVNGKKYIGITSQKPTKRWANGLGYAGCPKFYNAILKHGWDAFRHDLLFTDLSQEEAERLEVELIAKYKTQDPKYGYNLSAGGGGCTGYKLTEDQIARQKAALKGRVFSDEHKQHIKENHADISGCNHPNYGKKLKPETIKKIVENRACTSRGKHLQARRVLCIETGRIFDCVRDAAEFIGRYHNTVSVALNKSNRTAGGYHWRYADEEVAIE